jgi:hypothetical protein
VRGSGRVCRTAVGLERSFQLSAVSGQLRIQKGFRGTLVGKRPVARSGKGFPQVWVREGILAPATFTRPYEARRFDGFWPAKLSAVRLRLSKIRSVAEQRAERFAALRSRARAGSRRFAGASVRFVVSGVMIPASEAGRVPRTCHVPGSVDWAPDRNAEVSSAASIVTARPSHTSGSSGQALALRERSMLGIEFSVFSVQFSVGGDWGRVVRNGGI